VSREPKRKRDREGAGEGERAAVTGSTDLVARLASGDRRALARAISIIENGRPEAPAIVRAAFREARTRWIVGITGGPGAGKSTLVDRLADHYRADGDSVGVIAVDPTSPFTGGALLGDRVRMQSRATDPDVFIRSMATRGAVGGLAAATYDALTLLDAAGIDHLLVETVGVGQEEVDIAGVAHTTCVVLTPAGGDGVQAIKAGIMEIADIFVLNKSDIEGADRTESLLRAAATHAHGSDWIPPVVRTVASAGEGTEALVDAIVAHRQWSEKSGHLHAKRRALAGLRLRVILASRLWQVVQERFGSGTTPAGREGGGKTTPADREGGGTAGLLDDVAAGRIDPYTASATILDAILREAPE
jgi:LAO/AO transport system kinase